jgi:hypothetical protein
MSRASWNQLDSKGFASLLAQLVRVYYNRNMIECNETGITEEVYEILKVLTFVVVAEANEQVSRDLFASVESRFQRPKVARNALVKACQTPSVDKFAQKCVLGGQTSRFVPSLARSGKTPTVIVSYLLAKLDKFIIIILLTKPMTQ